jgi:hypothetical protein
MEKQGRVVLEKFDFIPFRGIGYIAVLHDGLRFPSGKMFKFCFPLMLERWYSETNIPDKFTVLKPQAKFEVSFKRKKWIETYYYMNFVFKKEHEDEYDRWRKCYIPESYLYFLEQYDEVEVPVCVITIFDVEEINKEEKYCLMHNFHENFYVFLLGEEERIYVSPKCDCERDVLDIVQRVVSLEIDKLLKKKKGKGVYPNLKEFWKYNVLYLTEKLQKVYDEELSKAKQMFGLNEEV